MDEKGFDNIARRIGGLRTRRDALKTAGCGAAVAVFAALGLENSALARRVGTENHCRALGTPCTRARQCCGWRYKSPEIRCKDSNAGSGNRCCGQTSASCLDDTDCCLNYFCNAQEECVHI